MRLPGQQKEGQKGQRFRLVLRRLFLGTLVVFCVIWNLCSNDYVWRITTTTLTTNLDNEHEERKIAEKELKKEGEGGLVFSSSSSSSSSRVLVEEEDREQEEETITTLPDDSSPVVVVESETTTSAMEETKDKEKGVEGKQEEEVKDDATIASSTTKETRSKGGGVVVESETSAVAEEASTEDSKDKDMEGKEPTTTVEEEAGEEDTGGGGNVDCYEHNTEEWLRGPRIGNTPQVVLDPYQTEQDLLRLIINSQSLLLPKVSTPPEDGGGNNSSTYNNLWKTVTQPTLCHKESTLLLSDENGLEQELNHLQQEDRQIYAAIHYHQVKYAIPEAQSRLQATGKAGSSSCTSSSTQQKELVEGVQKINAYDYECRDAKHIVVNLGGPGLGANVKGGINVALLAGLANNRVAHVMMNLPKPPTGSNLTSQFHRGKFPFQGWELASCGSEGSDHNNNFRGKDYQCVFMPLTPCTLTHQQFYGAHALNATEYFEVRQSQSGLIPQHLANKKVVIYQNSFTARSYTPRAAQNTIQKYIEQAAATLGGQNKPVVVPKIEWNSRRITNTQIKVDRLAQMITVYALRLLPHIKQQVMDMVSSEMKLSSTSMDKEQEDSSTNQPIIGLPIRASDKCAFESDCLTYEEHLQAATDFYNRQQQKQQQYYNNNATTPNLSMIVTTESLQIRQQHNNFTTALALAAAVNADTKTTQQQQNGNNNDDLMIQEYKDTNFWSNTIFEKEPPDGGNANPFKSNKLDADTLMIGSMASLHLQMHANTLFVANVCSNYHQLLYDLVSSGCSASATVPVLTTTTTTPPSKTTATTSFRKPPKFYFLQDSPNPWYRVCCFIKKHGAQCSQARQKYRPPTKTNSTSSITATVPQ